MTNPSAYSRLERPLAIVSRSAVLADEDGLVDYAEELARLLKRDTLPSPAVVVSALWL